MMAALRLFVAEQDFNRPSIEIALDLIYVANQYRVYKDHIQLGPAKELDQRPDIMEDANTYVPCVIDPYFDSRFDGRNGFMYRRLSLSDINGIDGLTIVPPFVPYKTSDVLDQINDKLSTQMTMDDLQELEYTTGNMELKAHPNSWVWTGTSSYTSIDPQGEPLFLFEDLSGFVKADPI